MHLRYHSLQAPGDPAVPPAQREAPNRLALLSATELDTSAVGDEASSNEALMALIAGLAEVQSIEDRDEALGEVRRLYSNRLPEGVRPGVWSPPKSAFPIRRRPAPFF